MKFLNIGTLNVKGCREEVKQQTICEDAAKYDLNILGITETHVEKETLDDITIKENNKIKHYKLYHGGIKGTNYYTGVGVIIEEALNPRFKRISDRILTANIKIDENHQMNIIVAYAPTLEKSEKYPELREDFYEILDKTIKTYNKSKHVLMILADMNAKTGSGHHHYPENIGKYGKGELNSNGEQLLDLSKENNLILTNTLFPHKLTHRTTWTSLERIHDHKHADGTKRRNQYRNQIGYVITKKNTQITNTRL